MNTESKNKHLESKIRSSIVNSIKRRYITPNANSNKIDNMMRKYSIVHIKKKKQISSTTSIKVINAIKSNQIY